MQKGEGEKNTYIDNVLTWVGPAFKSAVARFAVGHGLVVHRVVYLVFYPVSKFINSVLSGGSLFVMGLFVYEVKMLSVAYMDCADSTSLFRSCGYRQ